MMGVFGDASFVLIPRSLFTLTANHQNLIETIKQIGDHVKTPLQLSPRLDLGHHVCCPISVSKTRWWDIENLLHGTRGYVCLVIDEDT
jgi:hypothetical protein